MAELDVKEILEKLDDVHQLEIVACAKEFWYFAQFLVTDDEERQIQRPFPLPKDFPHIGELHDICNESKDACFLKSRRMQLSIYMCARSLWKAKFAGTGLPGHKEVFFCGYSAQDEDQVIYQFSRIQQMHDRLPDWIQSFNPIIKKNVTYKEFEAGGKIKGYPLKREGARGYGFAEFYFDEAGLQEAAGTTYAGLAPSIGKGKIFIFGTPRGKEGVGRFFYKVWDNKNNSYPTFTRRFFEVHENPEHDKAWLKTAYDRLGNDQTLIAQEYLGSFIRSTGDPVFPEFSNEYHVSREKIRPIEKSIMYIGWDFGYHWPACVLMQRDEHDRWLILREICGRSIDFGIFCKLCLEKVNAFYDRPNMEEIHCIDPAGFQRYSQRALSKANSDAHEVSLRWNRSGNPDDRDTQVRGGAVNVGSRDDDGPRISAMRKIFLRRDDGKYGVLIDPSCTTIIDGLTGAYAYDNYGKPQKTEESHPIDGVQYTITAFNGMVDPSVEKVSSRKKRERIGYRTGM